MNIANKELGYERRNCLDNFYSDGDRRNYLNADGRICSVYALDDPFRYTGNCLGMGLRSLRRQSPATIAALGSLRKAR